jgi:hypothetical protein
VSHVQSHLLSVSGAGISPPEDPISTVTDPRHAVTDEILSDDATDGALNPMVQLPAPTLGNLEEVELMIRQASSTMSGRDALGKFILNDDYIAKLIPLLEDAEDLESLSHLHRLCNIMKMIILLNDTVLVEKIVTDEMILGVVGILECMGFLGVVLSFCFFHAWTCANAPVLILQMTLTFPAIKPTTDNFWETSQSLRKWCPSGIRRSKRRSTRRTGYNTSRM